MRAITVRQPWAHALVHLGKNPENRTRNIAGTYRGPVAIHAGLKRDPSAWQQPVMRDAWEQRLREQGTLEDLATAMHASIAGLTLGAIIGVGQLTDVHPCADGCCLPWGEHEYVETRRLCEEEPTFVAARVHLVFADIVPLAEPIPATGALGLWTPGPTLVAAINAQLEEAA